LLVGVPAHPRKRIPAEKSVGNIGADGEETARLIKPRAIRDIQLGVTADNAKAKIGRIRTPAPGD
jgi:hypothetical protein